MFDINKIDTSKIIIICLVIFVLYLLYQYYDVKNQLQIVSSDLKNVTTQLNAMKNNINLINTVPVQQIKSPQIPINYIPQNINTNIQTNGSNKPKLIDYPIQTNNINNNTNIANLPVNTNKQINNVESEYSDVPIFNENNFINVNTNNQVQDINNDDDDDSIFNNGKTNVPHYGTCKDSEIKQKLNELKIDLENNNCDTETVKIDTEFIKPNPLLKSFVSSILTKISDINTNHMIDSENTTNSPQINLINDNQQVDLLDVNQNDDFVPTTQQNDFLMEENNNSDINKHIINVPTIQLDENLIEIDMEKHQPIDVNDILHTEKNNSDIELINKEKDDKVSELDIFKEKNNLNESKLTEKYNKMPLDQIKILCSEKKIKLSVNKTQKKKKDLVAELVNHIIRNNQLSKLS